MSRSKKITLTVIASLVISLGLNRDSFATCITGQQSCSSNYGVGSTFFGSGGLLDSSCYAAYCAKQALGETGVGLTSSSSYQAYAGFNVDRQPSLQFSITSANVNLGVLSDASTATGTATFSVEAYLAGGYSVISVSQPPHYATYELHALTSPTASAVGIEQFGINLVSNTTACGAPANFGANPVQVPSSAYSYGQAATGYNTCGLFQYIPNSIIAQSNKSSGVTDYTISYIENITSLTPAGVYSMNDELVAVPTY